MHSRRKIPTETSPLLSVRKVAQRWGISERTVRRIIETGDLPVHRIGGQIRCSPEDIKAYETRNRL
jgi:excisionase family DNA binding protein